MSEAYKKIVDIMSLGQLSREECGVLIGRLDVMRSHLPLHQKNYKPIRNPNHNPNITMIKCNRKNAE